MKKIVSLIALSFITQAACAAENPIVLCYKKELYRVDADGSNWTQLTNKKVPGHAPTCKNPSISADGKKIIYTYDPEFHGGMSLFSIDMNGKNELRITAKPRRKDAATWDASASLNGEYAAFAANRNGNWEIYTVKADGSQLRNITSSASNQDSPAWSPDGSKLLFIEDKTSVIYVMNADGSKQTPVTKADTLAAVPAWSPDGKKIAFVNRLSGENELWTMNPDGSHQRKVTDGLSKWSTISWSKDSQQLTFVDTAEYLTLVNIDGSDKKKVINKKGVYEPSWY